MPILDTPFFFKYFLIVVLLFLFMHNGEESMNVHILLMVESSIGIQRVFSLLSGKDDNRNHIIVPVCCFEKNSTECPIILDFFNLDN